MGMGGQRHAPAALPPGKRSSTHCIGGWVSPRAGVDGFRKSRPSPGFNPQTFQPVVSRYTDWDIPPLIVRYTVNNFLFDYKQKVCHYPIFFSPTLLLDKHALHGVTIKFANSSRWKCFIPHCWIPPWSPSKYSPWEAMHRYQCLVHPSKLFWNWFCGMAFRAAVVLLLMSSVSSKCLPFNISFIFGNRKKSLVARSGE